MRWLVPFLIKGDINEGMSHYSIYNLVTYVVSGDTEWLRSTSYCTSPSACSSSSTGSSTNTKSTITTNETGRVL
jgi:hypothetical protein